MAVNIKNALHILRWDTLINKARQRKLPGNLLTLLFDHLKDGEIIIKSINKEFESNVHAGVSQGSIAGQLLWNLVYNGLLNKFATLKIF
jgi:hypothetical protein